MIQKEKDSNKFVIDNSGVITLCEVEYKDDGSEWGQVSLVKVVEEFDSIDEAEDFTEKNDISVWGENKDWSLDSI
mgnify:CR=1 FL=1